MEIREILRLKPGVGGLHPPLNFGILLDRERTAKDHLLVLFTLNGEIKVRRKLIKEGVRELYHGAKTDEEAMLELLRRIIAKDRAVNILKADPKKIQEQLTVNDLWRSVIGFIDAGRTHLGKWGIDTEKGLHDVIFDPEEIGRIHYDPKYLDPKQVWAVGRVLSGSDDPREGYFNKLEIDNKPYYAPFTKEKMREIEEHVRRLIDLRSRYLEWEEVDIENPGRTRKVPRLKQENIADVKLEGSLKDDMEDILSWSRSYLLSGLWVMGDDMDEGVKPLSLGGTLVTRSNRFDLERFLEYLALDLTGTKKGDVASNLVTMLLRFGRITKREASELVVRYKIASGAQKFRDSFPIHVLREAERVPSSVLDKDRKDRRDLTGLETYTIDPPDAKDFDDAVSFLEDEDSYCIYVHIADVTHYVKENGLIDPEARIRSTSVYLPTGVLPMLPPALSEEICSLKEDVDRLSMTVRMVIDKATLDTLKVESFPAVIRVDKNLDYQTVEGYINEGLEPFSSLQSVTERLDIQDGRVDLEISERKIMFGPSDEILISIKRASRSTRMIETLMVRTNECIASYLEEKDLPNSYRVHPMPDKLSVERFNSAAEALSLDISMETDWLTGTDSTGGPNTSEDLLLGSLLKGGKLTLGALSGKIEEKDEEEEGSSEWNKPDQEDMKKAAEAYNRVVGMISSLQNERIRNLMRMRILRTMPRAFYTTDNIGHFGLNSMCYCHFTSPIRRYSDIITHRVLKHSLHDEGAITQDRMEEPSKGSIEEVLETVNQMSEDAEAWERGMIDVALSTRIEMDDNERKRTHTGTIMSLTPSSIYVLLDDGVTEGRLSLRHLAKGRLTVDEMETEVFLDPDDEDLEGMVQKQNEGPVPLLRLGDSIKVKVFTTSIAEGRVELSLAQNLGISQSSPQE